MSLTEILVSALIVVIGIIAVPVGKVIKTTLEKWNLKIENEISSIKDDNKRKSAEFLYGKARDVFTEAVERVNQDIVDDLKEAAADGKLTEEEKQRVYDKAIKIGKDMLGSDYVELYELLRANKADPEEYIRTIITAAVARCKTTSYVTTSAIEVESPQD